MAKIGQNFHDMLLCKVDICIHLVLEKSVLKCICTFCICICAAAVLLPEKVEAIVGAVNVCLMGPY